MSGVAAANAQPRLGSLGINFDESLKRLSDFTDRLQQASNRLTGSLPLDPPSPISNGLVPLPQSSIGALERTELDFRRVLDRLSKEVSRVEEL